MSSALRSLLAPAVATLVAFALLVALGVWQLDRLAWKEGVLAEIDARTKAAAEPLPPQGQWPTLRPADYEYRKVRFSGRFDNSKETLVFRGTEAGPGYLVMTPLALAGGGTVIVDRGWVPTDLKDAATRRAGEPDGEVTITGLMRAPEPRNLFTPADSPATGQFFTKDPAAIAAHDGLANVAPFVVDADAAPNPGGWPLGGQTVISIPNNHFAYAMTWFGLALTLVGVFGSFAWGRLKGPGMPGSAAAPREAHRLSYDHSPDDRYETGFVVKYISTRGEAPALGFTEAMLAGLARDGGLYLPQRYPQLSREEIAGLAGKSYGHVARKVLTPFVGEDLDAATLEGMIEAAYEGFRHKAVAPLAQLDPNLFVLELFHGPTLAFKDLAMQLVARFMEHALTRRGQHATVVGATSGDTGAAAIEAFRGLANIDVVIFYPHERVSPVQRRQMTTVEGGNIHVVALEGTFDDCQAAVKSLFNHAAFRDEYGLSGVNSINWARVLTQTVYYFTSAVALGAPHRPVSFAVPTGNFGDILAGWIAKRMGLPIERLVIATNENDILVRALETGAYDIQGVRHTQSPSMDIQISSNFERLLFEMTGRDGAVIRNQMEALRQSRGFTIPQDALAKLRAEFDAAATSEEETSAEIARCWHQASELVDPHTAVGLHVARRQLAARPETPMVVLGTAHAAKFPDAIERAIGMRPPLPAYMADLLGRQERFEVLPNDQARIERFIRERVDQNRALKTAS